ncbi:MAG: tryptophan-rich sensory protein [Clostridiales bacterium]|nr:tryptophan-rich sensory protein [Clostridiales bacterium]
MDKKRMRTILAFFTPVAFIFCGAALSGAGARLYGFMYRPGFAPGWRMFALGWAAACLLIGAAGAFLINLRRGARKESVPLYVAIVTFNFLWWMSFFGFYTYFAAFIIMIAIITAAAALFVKLLKTRVIAAIVFAPYIVWAAYCAALNFNFWLLNALF